MSALLISLIVIEVLLVRYLLVGYDEEKRDIEMRLKQQYCPENEFMEAMESLSRKKAKINLWSVIIFIIISLLIGGSDNILNSDSILH